MCEVVREEETKELFIMCLYVLPIYSTLWEWSHQFLIGRYFLWNVEDNKNISFYFFKMIHWFFMRIGSAAILIHNGCCCSSNIKKKYLKLSTEKTLKFKTFQIIIEFWIVFIGKYFLMALWPDFMHVLFSSQ